MLPGPRYVGTIGSAIASDFHMSIYCETIGCGHGASVDLEALLDKLGADYPVARFVGRSVCSRCGGRWPKVTIRVAPNLR